MSTLYPFLSKYLTNNTLIIQEQQIFSRLHNINTDMGDGEIQDQEITKVYLLNTSWATRLCSGF